MRRLALVAAVLAALAAPSTALGGGMGVWALHGPESGIRAGQAWLAQLRVVGCQGIPMDAVPTVAIRSESGRTVTFRGRPTGAPGKYTARVVFPSAGKWTYQVALWGVPQDVHGPFAVAPAKKEPSRLLAAVPPLGAVFLVLGTGLVLRRRRS